MVFQNSYFKWFLKYLFFIAAVACLTTKLCSTLCNAMKCSPPVSPVHGISQARILDRVAILSSRDISYLGIYPASLALAGRFFTTESPGKPLYPCMLLLLLSIKRLGDSSMLPHVSGHHSFVWLSCSPFPDTWNC